MTRVPRSITSARLGGAAALTEKERKVHEIAACSEALQVWGVVTEVEEGKWQERGSVAVGTASR